MQKVIQHLKDFLMNYLSSGEKVYLWSVGSFWASSKTTGRGWCRADCAADAAQASPEPISGARLGAQAGVSKSVSQGADCAESRVDPTLPLPRRCCLIDKSV
jgi:hypothetical protein